jgi:uncharacterized protein
MLVFIFVIIKDMRKTISKKIEKFKVKRSEAGLGLFSNVSFKKGQFVIEYTGKLLTNEESDKKGGRYLFSVNSRRVIDGTERKNLGRYINHSCRPNCEPWISGRKILIYAKKKIEVGEELTYDYGQEYFEEYIQPFGCRCQKCQEKNKPR